MWWDVCYVCVFLCFLKLLRAHAWNKHLFCGERFRETHKRMSLYPSITRLCRFGCFLLKSRIFGKETSLCAWNI